ncbi:MAG: hypothetical protein JWN62_4067 [Acidimicrobiales bacterium]|nr:hypothetical protein [Acidimicrobiales bacterium]
MPRARPERHVGQTGDAFGTFVDVSHRAAAGTRNTMSTKRELIEPNPGDKRYVRRDENGRFTEQVDVGKSSAADQRKHSSNVPKAGHGDEGDRAKK